MKLLKFCFFILNSTVTCSLLLADVTPRNPFEFAQPKVNKYRYRCLAIGKVHNTSCKFAFLSINNESHYVKAGSTIGPHKITEISDDFVCISNDLTDKNMQPAQKVLLK